MIKEKNISIDSYNYHLPEERIARYPLEKRDNSKLLVYKEKRIYEKKFHEINRELSKNSLLVFNNTRVIQARLHFKKTTGAKIEIFCLEPVFPSDYQMAFEARQSCRWKCIVGNLKKWKQQDLIKELTINGESLRVTAKLIERNQDSQIVEFSWRNARFSFAELLENSGVTPIPPYLKRESRRLDKTRYQTVYSKHNGSVAAPTAGLHFSENLLNTLKEKHISFANITLHVGAGTFRPVKSSTIGGHEMHTEHFFVDLSTIEQIIQQDKMLISVGTTSVRTLESLYWLGVKILCNRIKKGDTLFVSQWEVYDLPDNYSAKQALTALADYLKQEQLEILNAVTQIIIVPGYHFKLVQALITNFHLPKSTLLLLIAAFTGSSWKEIYDYALKNEFRFLSYGDSSLLFQNPSIQ